jgi:uroporphyrin-3 C-methyltransferase
MSSLPPPTPPEPPTALAVATPVPAPLPPRQSALSRTVLLVLALLAGAGLLSSVMLWQRLSAIQEHLARQTADSGANAIEARALARQAQDIARDAAARQLVLETRLSEVALQRTQLEDLIQSLSRSRDENLLGDIDSALRLAQQQTQLTGSAEPLLAELRTSDQRLARAAQPRLARLRASIARDIERIRLTSVTDVPALLARLDDVVRQVDDLPVANAVPARLLNEPVRKTTAQGGVWWERLRDALLEDARGLVRVSRIDQPDAVLLAPEQATFLRENLKLKLLNVRLSLLARQNDTARADLATAVAALNKYFDPASRRTQAVATQLQQVQAQVRSAEVPRVNDTLAAIATLSGGK